MSQAIRAGFTFHFNDRPDDVHLYVVISDPSCPEVVIVNVTTRRRWSDASCLLQPGDHPFVVQDSCIAFNYAEVVPAAELEQKLNDGDISPREPISTALMERVWDGAAKTRQMPLRCLQILRQQQLI